MKYQVGTRVTGIINNISDLGLFVSLPNKAYGLIHYHDFSGNWLRERQRYQVGQEVRVVVVKKQHGKIALSVKRLNDPTLIDQANQFSQTKTADFVKVLTKTAEAGKKEITILKQELTKNALS